MCVGAVASPVRISQDSGVAKPVRARGGGRGRGHVLTSHRLKMLRTYFKSGCNGAVTAQKMGVTRQAVSQTLSLMHRRPELLLALQQAGVTEQALADAMAEQVKATKGVVLHDKGKHTKTVYVPDNQARNKAVELALKVRGDFAPEQHQHLHGNIMDMVRALPPAYLQRIVDGQDHEDVVNDYKREREQGVLLHQSSPPARQDQNEGRQDLERETVNEGRAVAVPAWRDW